MRKDRKVTSDLRKVTIGMNTIIVFRTFGGRDLKELFTDYVVKKALESMNEEKDAA